MSNINSLLDLTEFQERLQRVKSNSSDPNFPHLAKEVGADRILHLKVTDPDLACTTLAAIMYGKDQFDIIPGLEWIATGTVGNGGYITNGQLLDWFKSELPRIQMSEDLNQFYRDSGVSEEDIKTLKWALCAYVDENINVLSFTSNHPLSHFSDKKPDSVVRFKSERGHELLWQEPLDIPVVTLENYEKWYSIYVLHPDGTVEKVSVDDIFEALDRAAVGRGSVWVDHYYHPELLKEVARMYNGEVHQTTLELAMGRWVINVVNR